MSLFNLSNRVFEVNTVSGYGAEFFPLADIMYDATKVKEITFAACNDVTDDFTVYLDAGSFVVGTSITELPSTSTKYELALYIEYVDIDGRTQNTIEKFFVYGFQSSSDMPFIKYIDNLATKVDDAAEITLHCGNLNTDLSVFLRINTGTETKCYKIPDNELIFDLDAQTISFVVVPGMFGVDSEGQDACGVYDINLGYGECEEGGHTPPFENSPEANLGLIRYKYDSSNAAPASTSDYTGEGVCWFASDMTLNSDSNDAGNPTDSSSATEGYGKTMYVRTGTKPGCKCADIKLYRVRLKYNTRLEHRKGELMLDGVQLRGGDIVWLAAQFDGTEGLWVVDAGDWYGLETLETEVDVIVETDVNGEETYSFNPCTGVQVPKKVDCTVFIDLGAKVNDKVKYNCSSDVPRKYGSQTICGKYKVKPGDIIALSNQSDGQDGIWQVTCTEWIFLGKFDGANGTNLDTSSQIITQNNIDFCQCGGIFHIDYYYLNSSCYLNHIRRDVKILCAGASIAPNASRQFTLTDYRISTGEDDSLVGNSSRFTVGDPVRENCIEEVTNYDYKYRMTSTEHLGQCTGQYVKSPACVYICDCPRFYNVEMTDDYSNSQASSGFTILFWQRGLGGWHLYAYIGEGKFNTGMNYYVYHLHTIGQASVEKVDVNEETAWYEIVDGERVLKRTKDAWFVEHGGVLADGFGLVDDSWEFNEIDEYGDRIPNQFTHILSENNLYQNWAIKCTTTFLAHRTYDPEEDPETEFSMRKTCADMADPEKADYVASKLFGMEHVFGFKFYNTVMSKDDFVKMYNSFDSSCINSSKVVTGIATDDLDLIGTDNAEEGEILAP